MRTVVVGGGVIGSAIAYYLTKAGAQVILIERGEIGGEASGAAAGMLIPPAGAAAPGPFRDLCLASLALYPALIESIQRESRIMVECIESGILVLAETRGLVQPLKAHARRQRETGVKTEWVEGAALREIEPALSDRVLGAAFSPEEKHVNPGLLTRALARAAEAGGAEIQEHTMLTGFLGRGVLPYGVRTSAGEITNVDNIVLAAGPWTDDLSGRLGVKVPTPPIRGQMLAYRSTVVRHAVWGENGFLVPKTGGVVFAGATVEDVGFRKKTTARALAGLRYMATALVPALRSAEVVSAWAGLRPGSPDGLPIIGRLPGRDNVYVAAGHFRNGILLAPITGKLVSQLILESRTEMALKAFGPERFGR
jgi:glycine oxidase